MADSEHKTVVQQEFTRQADAYAVAPTVSDPERIARLVKAVAPASDARVLDVACGPGFLALAFAAHCREAVGIDLTDAPLAIAKTKLKVLRPMSRNGGETWGTPNISNVRFVRGDADRLPFADGEFDVAVCRFALHHMEDPGRVLREMARVSRGTVAIEDLVTSEHRDRAEYQNHVERLRDPSHTRALAPSELIGLFTAAGLEVERLYSGETAQTVELWLGNSQTPRERASEVRALLERDAREDLSGMRPHQKDGQWFFRHRTLAALGRRMNQ
jgi:SAM-dependent methyltransferase